MKLRDLKKHRESCIQCFKVENDEQRIELRGVTKRFGQLQTDHDKALEDNDLIRTDYLSMTKEYERIKGLYISYKYVYDIAQREVKEKEDERAKKYDEPDEEDEYGPHFWGVRNDGTCDFGYGDPTECFGDSSDTEK